MVKPNEHEPLMDEPQRHADVDLARRRLVAGDCSVVVVSGGEVLSRAAGSGLLPLLNVLRELPREHYPVRVADRVVGMAAGLFLSDAADAIYAATISVPASDHLAEKDVLVTAGKEVPFIQNRSGTGLCPLEKIALRESDPTRAKRSIENFLQSP